MAQRQRSSQRGTRTLALPQPEGPSHQLGLFPVGSVADRPAGSQQPGRTLGTVADPGGRKQRCARPRERRRPGPQPPSCRTLSRCALLHAPHGLVVFPAILYEGPRKETCSVPSHCSRAFRRGLAEHLGVRCDARSPHHGPYGPLETKGATGCPPGPGASRKRQATPRHCGELAVSWQSQFWAATSAEQSRWSVPSGQSPGGHQVLTPALPSVCGCAWKPG